MKTLLIAAALLGVTLGCGGPVLADARRAHKQNKEPAMSQPELQWKMSLAEGGTKLRIDYKVTNPTKERLYVADKLVVPARNNKFTRSNSIIVMNADSPGGPPSGVVQFVLGSVSSDRPSAVLYEPTYRPLEPGQSLEASVEVPYPLRAWHSVGGANPINPAAKTAILVVHTFSGEPPKWVTLASDDAQPLKVPEGFTRNGAAGKPLPLPGH